MRLSRLLEGRGSDAPDAMLKVTMFSHMVRILTVRILTVRVGGSRSNVIQHLSLGPRVQGPGSRVQGPGSRVQGPGSRIQGPGSRVQGPGSRVQGSGLRVWGMGSRVYPAPLRRGSWARFPGVKFSHTLSLILTLNLSHTKPLSRTHTLSLTHTVSYINSHSHSHTLSLGRGSWARFPGDDFTCQHLQSINLVSIKITTRFL